MSPVRVRREVEGFVFNRLQGAVLREAYCLVRDGVATPQDIDRVMRDGPGRRWAILGPFEVAELNTRGGIDAHAKLLGPAYARMGAERGQDDPWTDDLVATVSAAVQARFPRDAWEDNVDWRDRALMALEACRRANPVLPRPCARTRERGDGSGDRPGAKRARRHTVATHASGPRRHRLRDAIAANIVVEVVYSFRPARTVPPGSTRFR